MTEETDDLELFKKYVYWTKEEVECYNAAIEKSIEIVKQHHVPLTERDVQLIFKLQALKK